jgi:hypothetical protein
MDAIHELIIGIAHPVTLQDGFSQPAQDASLDYIKSHPEDEQRRSLPDDFVLEDEMVWLELYFPLKWVSKVMCNPHATSKIKVLFSISQTL